MFILALLIGIYITFPIILTGYLSGIFLCKSGPMKSSDLRILLGLFFGIAILWIYIKQVFSETIQPITENLFSIASHYMVSWEILSFCLLILSAIIVQLLVNLGKSKRFPFFMVHSITGNVCNAQNEEGEYYIYVKHIVQIGPCNPEYPISG